MKYLFVTILSLTAISISLAQDTNNYNFTTGTTESLVDMNSGTNQLIGSNQTEVSSAVTSIGFDYYFMGAHYDQFSVNSNGVLRFGPTVVFNQGFDFNLDGQARIIPFARDNFSPAMGTSATGKVHYKVIGSEPDRILVVEWRNMEILAGSNSADGTFQLKIYESGPTSTNQGRFDLIYGNMSLDINGSGLYYNVGFGSGSESTKYAGILTSGPTFTPGTENSELYFLGNITNLHSTANGSRRYFYFTNSTNPPNSSPTLSTTDCLSGSSITLTWTHTDTNEASYIVYRSSDNVNFSYLGSSPAGTTSYVDAGLPTGTTYYYRVYSLTEGTLSSLSGTGSVSGMTASDPNLVYSIASGVWSDDNIWSNGAYPTIDKTVVIGCGGSHAVRKGSSAGSASYLTVENGSSLTLYTTSSNALSVQNDLIVNGSFDSNGGGVIVRGNLNNNGTFNHNGGSSFILGNLTNDGSYETGGGGLRINGNFTNNDDLNMDGSSVELRGNFNNSSSGTIDALNTGSLNFTGNALQSVTNTGNSTTKDTPTDFSTTGSSTIRGGGGNLASGNNYPSASDLRNCIGCGTLSVTLPTGNYSSLNSFTLSLTHDFMRDVDMYVLSPDNTVILLATDRGARGSGSWANTTYSDNAATTTPRSTFGANQEYLPDVGVGQLSGYNGTFAGTWTLYVNDDAFDSDTGTLTAFSVNASLQETRNELYLNDVTLDNGNDVTLNSPIHVQGALTLTDGHLITSSTNLLTIEDGATTSGGTTNSFVDGPMEKIGGVAFDFPVGDGDVFARIGISTPSVSGTFLAEYTDGRYSDIRNFESTINTITNVEYWTLSETSSSGAAVRVKLFSSNFTRSKLTNPADIVVAHYTGGQWENEGGTYSAGEGSFTTTNPLSSFSPFTFGSTSASTPLPVELVSFTGKNTESGNLLQWQTATEKNNAYFEVQRSRDTRTWEALKKVEGNGTISQISDYQFLDESPYTGTSYYRLRQVDLDGTEVYTHMVAVTSQTKGEFELISYYPNPNFGKVEINYFSPDENETLLRILDIMGRVIYQESRLSTVGNNRFELNTSSFGKGTHLLSLQKGDKIITKRFINH